MVITGPFNWSPAAAHTNDETLLVIESPKLAAHFTREMIRMWRGDASREEPVSCGGETKQGERLLKASRQPIPQPSKRARAA